MRLTDHILLHLLSQHWHSCLQHTLVMPGIHPVDISVFICADSPAERSTELLAFDRSREQKMEEDIFFSCSVSKQI